jgi:hypothetical protein
MQYIYCVCVCVFTFVATQNGVSMLLITLQQNVSLYAKWFHWNEFIGLVNMD